MVFTKEPIKVSQKSKCKNMVSWGTFSYIGATMEIINKKYKNFHKKAETNSHRTESMLAKILKPCIRYKESGSIFLIRGICFSAYRMPFTR